MAYLSDGPRETLVSDPVAFGCQITLWYAATVTVRE